MKPNEHILPLFLLDLFLLVGGRTRLRVFEPRYKRLVSLAAEKGAFVIANSNSLNCLGCKVHIINFDTGPQNMLEIDVECSAIVEISPQFSDADRLHHVAYTEQAHWSAHQLLGLDSSIAGTLQQVIYETPLLKLLYADQFKNDLNWVIARWLEILPIKHKELFFYQSSFEQAKQTVENIIGE